MQPVCRAIDAVRLPGARNSPHTACPANLFNFKLNESRTKASRLWAINANVRT